MNTGSLARNIWHYFELILTKQYHLYQSVNVNSVNVNSVNVNLVNVWLVGTYLYNFVSVFLIKIVADLAYTSS